MTKHDSHGDEEYSTHGYDEHHGKPHDVKKYLYVFLALCVLTMMSFFTYSEFWPFHEHPQVGWTFMMAVSLSKALLVMLFFMHLKYEASWKYVLTIPASVMSVFLVIALIPDVKWRYETIVGGRTVSPQQAQFLATPADMQLLIREESTDADNAHPDHDTHGDAHPDKAH